jgi:hypothetical protein
MVARMKSQSLCSSRLRITQANGLPRLISRSFASRDYCRLRCLPPQQRPSGAEKPLELLSNSLAADFELLFTCLLLHSKYFTATTPSTDLGRHLGQRARVPRRTTTFDF